MGRRKSAEAAAQLFVRINATGREAEGRRSFLQRADPGPSKTDRHARGVSPPRPRKT